MNLRMVALAALVGCAGCILVLAEVPWFARRALIDRLRPYCGTGGPRPVEGFLSIESFREAIAPFARVVGQRVSRVFGVQEDLARRLERVHAPFDVTQYRVRQLRWAAVAFAAVLAASAGLRIPPAVALLFALGAPVLAFLVLEQRIAAASAAWQARILAELPVVAEHLGMLLGAGYSLGAALQRIAARGGSACSTDLALVCTRIGHGLSELDALREWAELADVDALHQLVAVLALDHQGGDLSRLVGDAARATRRDAQRRLVETIERRTQQVWIPVTVAALVPGVIFLAVPFVRALSLFSSS